MMKTLNVWTVDPNEKLIGKIECDVIIDKNTCYLAVIDDVDITAYLKEFEKRNNVQFTTRNITSSLDQNKNLYRASVYIEAGDGLYQEAVFKYLKKDGKRLFLKEICGNELFVNTKTKIGQMLLESNHVTIKN